MREMSHTTTSEAKHFHEPTPVGWGHPKRVHAAVWLTGLPGAGKTTLAEALAGQLRLRGEAVVVLDGDALRAGLCSDLGFAPADRVEHMRRAAELARLLAQQGLRVVVALIAPYAAERQAALARIGHCLEVHVAAPAAVRQARDPKGHYARAQQGLLPQFTGVGAPYEAPERPALRIDTSACTPEEAVAQLLALLPP